jgi:hypothetical protein
VRKGLTPGFFAVVCLLLVGTGGFIVLQNQLAVTSDIRSVGVDSRIEAEKARQKSLRVQLAQLKSPDRVARVAQDELGMKEPDGVIYLKYGRDRRGDIVSQSTYEQWSEPASATANRDKSASAASTDTPEAITKR